MSRRRQSSKEAGHGPGREGVDWDGFMPAEAPDE
jgi:hypothetical protein